MSFIHHRKVFQLFTLNLFLGSSLFADLLSGPMLGPIEMREAKIWVQTEEASQVRIAYKPSESEPEPIFSAPVETESTLAHATTITLDGVEPGINYSYQVELDGELLPETYSFETPPFFKDKTPPPNIRIAIGGAHYVIEDGYEPPYSTLGGNYGIFSTILEKKPDFMIWAGNTSHLRDTDWASGSGYLKRFSTTRSLPESKEFFATIPQYATWGSRDFGSNDAGRYYTYRSYAEKSFGAFWPTPVEISTVEGIATRFRRSDVDFFMLDVRSYRNDIPLPGELPQIIGDEQIEWLRQELIRSDATFKIIIAGAPILNPADSPGNLSYAESEHTKLLQILRDERISGLFFISGGKYYGELTRLEHANSYSLFDLTVGPLTATPKDEADELNFFKMPATSVFEKHFALIDFEGPEEDRELTIRVLTSEGEELWNRTIKAAQLQPIQN